MNTIFVDSNTGDDVRRQQLFCGQLFTYSPTPSSLGLVELARRLIREAFEGLDPETAQCHIPVEKFLCQLIQGDDT